MPESLPPTGYGIALLKVMYEPRTYRHWVQEKNLISFSVVVKETDLYIRASSDLKSEALKSIFKYREQIERYIECHPLFATSLEPVTVTADSPLIIKDMAASSCSFNVGPMAAVA